MKGRYAYVHIYVEAMDFLKKTKKKKESNLGLVGGEMQCLRLLFLFISRLIITITLLDMII